MTYRSAHPFLFVRWGYLRHHDNLVSSRSSFVSSKWIPPHDDLLTDLTSLSPLHRVGISQSRGRVFCCWSLVCLVFVWATSRAF